MRKAEIAVGGQALIEGVMMRSANTVGMAVRCGRKIKTRVMRLRTPPKIWGIPFFRGIYNLVSMLAVGIKALNWSAEQSAKEEEISDWALTLTFIFSFALGIALFVLLPYALTFLVGVSEDENPVAFNFIDGIIKIIVLLAYVYGISLLGEVKKLYQYHGAEHKVVHCYEGGMQVTVENAKKFPTLHPRCGTSFLFIVVIVGIVVFSFTPLIASSISPGISRYHWFLRRFILFFMRIAFLPIVAGIAYEFLKWSAKYARTKLGILVMPGLLLQRITTREPTRRQVEVAIAALNLVVGRGDKRFKK